MAGCDFLALWEAGEADHPLDRALGLIETLEGTPRAEAANAVAGAHGESHDAAEGAH